MTRPALPDWLDPLPDAARMRATDAWAIDELGIPGVDLMDRAGAALASVVERVAPQGTIAVVCGKGNNGGDGYVLARLLREQGRDVRVLVTAPVAELRGDAAHHAALLPGPGPVPFAAAGLHGVTLVVDAILGTGVTGEPRGAARYAIDAIVESGVPVVACDVPSGVDASTGEAAGVAIRAVATATFHAAKPGLWINPGKERSGVLAVCDIGIPAGAPTEPADVGLLTERVLDGLPGRGAASTKFTSGHVLVAGGSRGLTGAPCLAALGAMRGGAGYVTACVPGSLEEVVAIALMEAMTVPLPDHGGALVADGAALVAERAARRGGALVLGPGLGTAAASRTFARGLAAVADVPLVLDADGLGAHAGRVADLAARTAPTVLTPHAGELARLLDTSSERVQAARLEHAHTAAEHAHAVVVLKGDDTLVADPDGRVAISQGGAPALATAGTGDVLAGLVGALLAQGVEPFRAACAAVELHARAGRLAAEQHGPDGVVAGDVAAALGRARLRDGDRGAGR
ncbi:NAD(P)H-hydrate dehydratase [Conexibacter sp. W3-3-2]|uniref:NAD(P)H-hydrate dehydratase n=1 Tax=Conexibacter sp. W3-3-2 TaxID=2675227 RepID=UPI0012B6DBE9|nr:NAD(P)H-hydrate dehydratase [Conexibacter sp. W3-3-2]MTD47072.1 NAD(P)H-hydrate dehydratase [Conexibacter sp. W3-3-2]